MKINKSRVTLKTAWKIVGQLTSDITRYAIEESDHVFVILKNGKTDTVIDKESGYILL
jgi:hypothetical protein